ncbi:MAG: PAS domain-containing sensor histidine kinase [Proteobacteria bacterium]|nr:PAS domain-containing sensor histidine kinase [Pseudomonadota bacterium]
MIPATAISRAGKALAGNQSRQRKFAFMLSAFAILSGIATVAVMTLSPTVKEIIDQLRWLLVLDGALMLLLSIVVARRLIHIWRQRRLGRAGAGLQGRLVLLFAAIAITPAVLVAIFSYLFLHFGLQTWFSDRVSRALRESVAVTDAYLVEHRKNILNEGLSLAGILNRNAPYLTQDAWEFKRLLTLHATTRGLTEAVVIDRAGNVLARKEFTLSPSQEPIPGQAFDKVDEDEVTLIPSEREDKVRALIRLNRFVNAYLLVERFVDSRVVQHIDSIQTAFREYKALEQTRSGIQISFVLIYMIAALVLVLAAIWVGMTVSAGLAEPISDLIDAADKVSKGDLTARVDSDDVKDELGVLGRTFNNMTARISSQQDGLMAANRELDERRRFTETVLAGVSAGVVGLDFNGLITLPNRSSSELIGIDLGKEIEKPLASVVPELAPIIEEAMSRPDRLVQAEVKLLRQGHMKTLLVRVAAERLHDQLIGYVVTFDDVTELLSAQRMAAWADVARRIAHEIKNPLTPIQLSAERLMRKYGKEVQSDPAAFKSCTDTIIRQVEDIGRMVDEFSSFARMPQPEIKRENISEICRQAVFLERSRGTGVKFRTELPGDDIYINCDGRQIARALGNVLKNAAEAIVGADEEGNVAGTDGEVVLKLVRMPDRALRIVIEDDGKGLPSDGRDRLTEPYVTTRVKGTGLGLAIVKKIMEDHDGDLRLEDRLPNGAKVVLEFPGEDATEDAAVAALPEAPGS